MRLWLSCLWKNEHGALLVTDWVFIATILVLVLLPTVASFHDRVHQTRMLHSRFRGGWQNRAVLPTAANP
jgi:hypothetical protein